MIGETWLYKCEINEISQSHYRTVIARDVFSFWAPLDESFLRLMINLSYYLEVEVVNPFWMQYFWGYLPYTLVTESMNMNQRFDTLGKITAQNMATGNLTIVGETYKEMIQV